MKIAVCEFRQETNAFNPVLASRESFVLGGIAKGEEMLEVLGKKPCAVHGMFQAIREAGGEIVPLYSMVSQSGGIIAGEVFDEFLEVTEEMLSQVLPVDGVFVSLHGATQSEQADDACGVILERIRALAGPEAIIAASCDMHANVTARCVQNADFVCGYQTYPHADYMETGYRAARLGMQALTGGPKPRMVRTVIPMIVPASGYHTLSGPFAELIQYGKSLVEEEGRLLDFSIFQMQPWLDVTEGGTSVVATAFDVEVAKKYARELAQRLWSLRKEFRPQLYTIDQVIDLALENDCGKPVVLVDSADSTNAGAAGDSPAVVARILERNVPVKAACVLDDREAADQAHELGVGAVAEFVIGGKKDPKHARPVRVKAEVKSLHDGIFMQEGPAGQGLVNNVGRAAVLSVGAIDIMVCQNVAGNGDPQLYRHFGIEPSFYQLVVVKACTSFRAAFAPIAAKICETDTPGAAASRLENLGYEKLPKTFYPFSDLDDYRIPEPQEGRPPVRSPNS